MSICVLSVWLHAERTSPVAAVAGAESARPARQPRCALPARYSLRPRPPYQPMVLCRVTACSGGAGSSAGSRRVTPKPTRRSSAPASRAAPEAPPFGSSSRHSAPVLPKVSPPVAALPVPAPRRGESASDSPRPRAAGSSRTVTLAPRSSVSSRVCAASQRIRASTATPGDAWRIP